MIELSTLKATILSTVEVWPSLVTRINDGAVIVTRGLTKEVEAGEFIRRWKVKQYDVAITRQRPPRWVCNCKHLGDISGDFLGHPGSICKHIAAAALQGSGKIQLAPPANLAELINRLLYLEVLPGNPDTSFSLTPNGIRLGFDVKTNACVLKNGHKKSGPLIIREIAADGTWRWVKVTEFEQNYHNFAALCRKGE